MTHADPTRKPDEDVTAVHHALSEPAADPNPRRVPTAKGAFLGSGVLAVTRGPIVGVCGRRQERDDQAAPAHREPGGGGMTRARHQRHGREQAGEDRADQERAGALRNADDREYDRDQQEWKAHDHADSPGRIG